METNLNFSSTNYNKSSEELLFKIEKWISDLTYYKTEIEFLKKIINTYPFTSNTRNLFENLQIFNKDLENSDSDRGVILKKIAPLKFQLKKNNNKTAPQNNVQFIDLYNNIEDEMLTFTETYKSLKNTIYNYINAILVV